MKSKFLLFLSFVLIQSGVFSQELWPHENGEWWSQITYYLFLPAWEHSYVDGDTLIDDKLCTKFTTDRIYAFPNEPENVQIQQSNTRFIHYNGDTLFWRYENSFYPLICFNAEVGDSWYPLPETGIQADCDIQPITVIEADSIEYNGDWFRRIRLEGIDEQTDPFFWGGYFDERTFGRNFFFPSYNICEGIVEWIQMSFICYGDGELFIPNADGQCGLDLSAEQGTSTYLKVYPNPIRPGETLTVEGAEVISLVSASGTAFEPEQVSDRLRIPSDLITGIYMLELLLPSGKTIHSKLLVR